MHYRNDFALRWSPEDLAAQQEFVIRHVENKVWLDWSDDAAVLSLIQADLVDTTVSGSAGEHEAILVAGPITELIRPATLFQHAAKHLRQGGTLIGIIPCLRDNSPESRLFAERTAQEFWSYHTAEELLELLHENGFEPIQEETVFIPITQFKDVVLKDQLGFKGFRHVFTQIEAEGYDPVEIGWGELRFVAQISTTETTHA